MIADFALSPHFSFHELTITGISAFQETNREVAMSYLPTLKALASFLERIRDGRALMVNSAFRSGSVNAATRGSSPTSQHPMGQAADIHRPNQSIDDLFPEVLSLFKREKIPFGQIIDESAKRDYGIARWLHVSLGRDFWKPERCGEVLRKVDGPDGKPIYTLLEKVPQEGAC